MHSIFENLLHTDEYKGLVREYEKDFDSQSVHKSYLSIKQRLPTLIYC